MQGGLNYEWNVRPSVSRTMMLSVTFSESLLLISADVRWYKMSAIWIMPVVKKNVSCGLIFMPHPVDRGVYTRGGGNGARCTVAKIGGECCDDNDAFARVYNNLLLHEIHLLLYTSTLLTCCLPLFYTVSQKTSPMFLAITHERIVGSS